jgi:S-adenosylmethionine:tRNA ribosyltransferase-isomerase
MLLKSYSRPSKCPHVLTSEFDFQLPPELIAQQPAPARDSSRLLVLHREANRIEHRAFADLITYLRAGDVLVLNDSKVIPARLRATNPKTGGAFEILLLEENARNDWWAMMRPAKRARVGTELSVADLRGSPTSISATVIETNEEGHRRLRFQRAACVSLANLDLVNELDHLGEVPLPPYIKRSAGESSPDDRARYQTVYANEKGSVAAPTAGLHFTEEIFSRIRERGADVCHVTLHVGLGTFAPVKAERVEEHTMHFERFRVEESVAQKINEAKSQGRRIVAVGTTSVRVLETLARENNGAIVSGSGRTNIFIYPPFPFRIVDAIVTNFHLPCSTLLMLVSAFASPDQRNGREKMFAAYAEAVKERYRFFSYGDAMLIL